MNRCFEVMNSGDGREPKKMLRIHVFGFPHTKMIPEYGWCAYTGKARKFVCMMLSLGHVVIVYDGDQFSDAIKPFHQQSDVRWDENDPVWTQMFEKIRPVLRNNFKPGDILALTSSIQFPLSLGLDRPIVVEVGVGYQRILSQFAVYESYAWLHCVNGAMFRADGDGRSYDEVIFNSYEEDDFPDVESVASTSIKSQLQQQYNFDGDYCFFIGRLINRKGLLTAILAAQAARVILIVAGAGDCQSKLCDFPHVRYGGLITDVKLKNILYANAVCTLVPTHYIGPFEGVHVESLMSGTPVLTTDFGAFTETFEQGNQGYRCKTLGNYVAGILHFQHRERSMEFKSRIQRYARGKFSTRVIRFKYERYLRKIHAFCMESIDYLNSEVELPI